MWWHNLVNTGGLHSFQQDTSMQPEITGLLFFKAEQILSLLLELCTHENITSPRPSRWRTKPSCLKVAGRRWLLAHNMEFTPSWISLLLFLPAPKAQVNGWLPFPLQFYIPCMTAVELHRNDTKLQKEEHQALKIPLLLTTKMFKNCISFNPFEI